LTTRSKPSASAAHRLADMSILNPWRTPSLIRSGRRPMSFRCRSLNIPAAPTTSWNRMPGREPGALSATSSAIHSRPQSFSPTSFTVGPWTSSLIYGWSARMEAAIYRRTSAVPTSPAMSAPAPIASTRKHHRNTSRISCS